MGFLGLWIVALAVILGSWGLLLADRWPDAAPTIVVNETAAPTELSDADRLGILLEEESNR